MGPAGGIVFYITEECTHGLEAAPVDQGTNLPWGCFGTEIGANGLAIGTGAQNTADILADGCSAPAAEIADSYSLNGFNDWFLPSKDELNELYLQKLVVGGLANDYYSSSSEINSNSVWVQFLDNGFELKISKNNFFTVRAVRAF